MNSQGRILCVTRIVDECVGVSHAKKMAANIDASRVKPLSWHFASKQFKEVSKDRDTI